MLKADRATASSGVNVTNGEPSFREFVDSIARIASRQFRPIAAITAGSIAIALAYLAVAPVSYTAIATMVIDTRKVQLLQQQSVLGDVPIDSAAIETQIQLLKSDGIGLRVVNSKRLFEDPEFGGYPGARAHPDLLRTVVARFQGARSASRVNLTYAIEVRFRSRDPEKAATLANAVVEAYIADQLDAKYQATNRASIWLQERIRELQAQATTAERAVVDYKKHHNIVDTGGRLVSEQRLAEINSQLVLARASTAEAKARLDRINDILQHEIPTESVADALKNETIIKLRGQYVEAAMRAATLAQKYGEEHLAVVNLRNQMREIQRSVGQELVRIQQAYRSDYDIAKAREESIQKSFADVVSEAQTSTQAKVQQRELESDAQIRRVVYDTFLQRYMESVQQKSSPFVEARLSNPATPPGSKSHPKSLLTLAIALLGGLCGGISLACFREFGDHTFRTRQQVERTLRRKCVGMIPMFDSGETVISKIEGISGADWLRKIEAGVTAFLERPSALPGSKRATRPFEWALTPDRPASEFAESIHALRTAIDLNLKRQAAQVIGITSTMPGEGKTTLAANLAKAMAQAGRRVVLIDGDLHNRSLSQALAPHARHGLAELATDGLEPDLLALDAVTGNPILLPAGNTARFAHSTHVIDSSPVKALIAGLRQVADCIIIDLPPLTPVLDVHVTGDTVDAYLYVVEWGRSPIGLVEDALSDAPGIAERLLGIVLTKYEPGQLGLYGERGHGAYYPKRTTRDRYSADQIPLIPAAFPDPPDNVRDRKNSAPVTQTRTSITT